MDSGLAPSARPGMTKLALTRIGNGPILSGRDDRTCPYAGQLKTAQGSTRRSFAFQGSVIPGHAKRELWCAVAHLRISRFRARCCASPRNDSRHHKSKPPVCFRKRAARGQSGLWGLTPEGLVLRRRLVVRRRRAILVLGHERVELFLVLGVTQARQEILEFLLLLLE